MLEWWLTVDETLLRWINLELANPLGDALIELLNRKLWHLPLLVLGLGWLLWKIGPLRGRWALALVVVMLSGDGLLYSRLKRAIGRPRPFLVVQQLEVRAGRGRAPSMPSSHAANWFAAATVCGLFYRPSRRWLFGAAALVGFLRVYGGVHYPSDVLVGALVGAGWALAVVWAMEWGWHRLGAHLLPSVWARWPHLLPAGGGGIDPAPDGHKLSGAGQRC